MRYALVDGIRRLPEKKLWGNCPVCGEIAISKCGSRVVHHWAHKSGADCDTWSEPIGPWHLEWQGCVSPDCIEVVMGKHRADIVGKASRVIELQHSPISSEDVTARETFYGDMIWLFDATKRFEFITVGRRAFFSLRQTKHLSACTKPVYLDFGSCIIEVEAFTKAVAKMNGFGIVRSRQWFAEQYLDSCEMPPATLEGRPIRWSKDRRYDSTKHATNWHDARTLSTVNFPTGSVYLPMNWYEVRVPRIFEWERVIDQHPELANGWTKDSLPRMEKFLNGKIIMLDGQLRLMPSAAASISVSNTVSGTRDLLAEVDVHIAAGRIPILKDSTKEHLLRSAAEYEIRTGGRREPPGRSLFN